MIVLKFGGTSVQDAPSMNGALDIAQSYLNQAPLLISSAMSGVTNDLIKITECIEKQDRSVAEGVIKALEERHNKELKALTTGENTQKGHTLLEEIFQEIRALTKGSLLLGECSPRVYDAIVASGELLSTRLLYLRCLERGIDAELIDSRKVVKTDDHFGEAAVDFPATNKTISGAVTLKKGRLGIAQGFIGSTAKGVTTILGRGGSDYSATIFGAALKVKEVQIWTDVNGIMTTDPRKVPGAHSIPEISYEEAAELAYFGAKVVHPATIQPAVELGIPVWVKNTKNPSHPGTAILPKVPGQGLRAISGKKGITLITVTSSRMLNAYGFLSRIFQTFANHKVPVDLVATSEVSVSMTIDETHDLGAVVQELESLGRVKVEKDCGILCLVGQNLWKDTVFLTRVFATLPGIPVRLISLGSSDINLSLVVPLEHLDEAVRKVHHEFFS